MRAVGVERHVQSAQDCHVLGEQDLSRDLGHIYRTIQISKQSPELSLKVFLMNSFYYVGLPKETCCTCSRPMVCFHPQSVPCTPPQLPLCLLFLREHFAWDLHAHKAQTYLSGLQLTPSQIMSVNPEMVDFEGFISKGIESTSCLLCPILFLSATFFSGVLCLHSFSHSPIKNLVMSEIRIVINSIVLFPQAGMKIVHVYQGPGTILSTLHILTHLIFTVTL